MSRAAQVPVRGSISGQVALAVESAGSSDHTTGVAPAASRVPMVARVSGRFERVCDSTARLEFGLVCREAY